jgi:hypothetical protein
MIAGERDDLWWFLELQSFKFLSFPHERRWISALQGAKTDLCSADEGRKKEKSGEKRKEEKRVRGHTNRDFSNCGVSTFFNPSHAFVGRRGGGFPPSGEPRAISGGTRTKEGAERERKEGTREDWGWTGVVIIFITSNSFPFWEPMFLVRYLIFSFFCSLRICLLGIFRWVENQKCK